MYYIVFVILFWGSLIEIFTKKLNRYLFYLAFGLMTLMTCLRYGQNADYFGYKDNYLNPDETRSIDFLFVAFQDFCRQLGLSYEFNVLFCGLIVMGFMLPFLSKKTLRSSFALLVIYSLFFLIYPMGVIRQGIALSLLLWAYIYLEDGKKYLFLVLLFIGSLIHVSLITAIFIYFVYNKRFFEKKLILWLILGMTFYSAFVPDMSWIIQMYFPDRSVEGGLQDTRWAALLLRLLSIIPVYLIKPPYGTPGYNARSICITGYCIYCFLSFDSLIAGRVEVYYRIFFCLFCSYLVFQMKRYRLRYLCLVFILFLQSAYFFKNIDTMRSQGDYRSNVTTMSFPYISVLDKEDLEYYTDMVDNY